MKTWSICLMLLVHGLVFSQVDTLKSTDLKTVADTDVMFPGGRSAMNKFFSDNIVYPKEMIELGLSGKCYVKFTIDETGKVITPRIIRGMPDCPECDREVIRLFRIMPNWIPATQKGKPISVEFQTPITLSSN